MRMLRFVAIGWLGLGGALLPSTGSGAGPAPSVKRESPFACNAAALDPAARKRHFDELGPSLRAAIRSVRELSDGYEFELPADAETYRNVTEWAAGERLCCPFFDIDVRADREEGAIHLRLTGRKGTKQFIEVDGAAWIKR